MFTAFPFFAFRITAGSDKIYTNPGCFLVFLLATRLCNELYSILFIQLVFGVAHLNLKSIDAFQQNLMRNGSPFNSPRIETYRSDDFLLQTLALNVRCLPSPKSHLFTLQSNSAVLTYHITHLCLSYSRIMFTASI